MKIKTKSGLMLLFIAREAKELGLSTEVSIDGDRGFATFATPAAAVQIEYAARVALAESERTAACTITAQREQMLRHLINKFA